MRRPAFRDTPDGREHDQGEDDSDRNRACRNAERYKLSAQKARLQACEKSEQPLILQALYKAFQADDEGSIPFTHSNDFNNLDMVPAESTCFLPGYLPSRTAAVANMKMQPTSTKVATFSTVKSQSMYVIHRHAVAVMMDLLTHSSQLKKK